MPTPANAINEATTGICGFTGTAFTSTAATNHAVLIGGSTSSTLSNVGPTSTAGQVLQSAGASADPTFSTATFPSTATGTGTLLRADGTNWVATTSTYPNTNAVNTLLYASSANVMAALATANTAVLATDGSGVPSITATPTVTSITFGSGSALSIFQQGTFTPTIVGSSTAGTVNVTSTVGRYQKVGRIVTVSIYVVWTTIGTATGSARCNNLPFTVINDANAAQIPSLCSSVGNTMVTTSGAVPFVQSGANTTNATLTYYTGSDGQNHGTTITASNGFGCQYVYETV